MFDTPTLSRVYLSHDKGKPPRYSTLAGARRRSMAGRVSGGRKAPGPTTSSRGGSGGVAELPNVWRLGLFVSRKKKNI